MIEIILKLIFSKDGFYIAIITAALGAGWYVIDDWHYEPIRVQDETITMLGNQLNECIGIKDQCEADIKKENVENYQDGLGEGNENFNFDLDNLTS